MVASGAVPNDARGVNLIDLARSHHAFVPSDNQFQRRARVLQALWREEQGLPIGEHRGRRLGSRIAMPEAEVKLSNYLTDTIREAVRREVLHPGRDGDKLYGRPRIFNDLLSSQPLCFNLFAELQADDGLASKVFAAMTKGRVDKVKCIEFEHSSGRGDPRFTSDRSAFDVYVEHETKGKLGFIGIEVKYHEGLGDQPAPHRDRYDEIAAGMKAFRDDSAGKLKHKPLQQIWRDHLLAGSLLLDKDSGFDDGMFVFLYPRDNYRCANAVADYRACLADEKTFAAWTLEDMTTAIKSAGAGAWIDAFVDRYLAFDKLEEE